MDNRVAAVLGGLIVLAVVGDQFVFGGEHLLFLAKKLVDLINWLAFWN